MEKSSFVTEQSAFTLFITRLDKFGRSLSKWFEYIAIIGIVGMIAATTLDVVSSKLFQSPMAAGTEVVYFLQIIAIAGSLAVTKIAGMHIRLEFTDSLSKKVRGTFNFFAALLGLLLFILLTWKSAEYAITLKNAQEVTAASRIPLYPFGFWISLCCIPICLLLLKDILSSVIEVIKK
jgi:TRAP-type C4-dicarboxylate transport system permease small subunit